MRALALALLACAATARRAARGAPSSSGVASALEKLRPGDAVPGARAVDLVAARGECESAQVAVRAAGGLRALSASAAPLRGAARLPVTLYRVATVPLARPSGPDGAAGEWPDPLVPVRDPFFGEARRAFPVEVAPGRLQAIWVELCVPEAAPAGAYAGERPAPGRRAPPRRRARSASASGPSRSRAPARSPPPSGSRRGSARAPSARRTTRRWPRRSPPPRSATA